ncbi:hypothetical protein N7466_003238 [Penicillium verhagenii]|uniref:uncharacterized protein n=1 Tax=Penicillium verhagenii TaxID=1562060 RepID=UPI002545A8A0|nr:uncharacterized protein N7466_003238 [Penicillium verhagenii]KAJ5936788.1 hypothetical protein N7466_003238 [Penicillium verhagenii]
MAPRGSSAAGSPAKKTPRKSAARGKWSEEHLLTSDKSLLIDTDLVKLLASSAAWHVLEEDEKRQILDLLPVDTHPDPDPPEDNPNAPIPPLPDSFVRYSNNWRDGIRQFQLDLQNGRYDPEWLRQADEARQQRENGDFDSFKEREYEEFWGQKQKLDKSLPAGESGKVKLATLVDEGVIRIGDVWRFNYVYGKGAERIFIDKEARVTEIKSSKLTFVMPAGQRVFLRAVPIQSASADPPKTESPEKWDSTPAIQSTEPQNTEDGIEEVSRVSSASPPQEEDQDEVQLVEFDQDHLSQSRIEVEMDTGNDQSQDWDDVPRHEERRIAQSEKESVLSSPLSSPCSIPPPYSPLSWHADEVFHQEADSHGQVLAKSPTRAPRECLKLKRPLPQPAEESPTKRTLRTPLKSRLVEVKPGPVSVSKEKHGNGLVNTPKHQSVQVVIPSPRSEIKPENTTDKHNPDRILHSTSTPHQDDKNVQKDHPPLDLETSSAKYTPKHLVPGVESSLNVQSNSDCNSEPKLEAEGQTATAQSPTQPQDSTQVQTDELEEVIVRNIKGPSTLVNAIVATDGRASGRTANAWKEIRCYRNNQDMGSLWDVRLTWYHKNHQ